MILTNKDQGRLLGATINSNNHGGNRPGGIIGTKKKQDRNHVKPTATEKPMG